MQMVRLDTVLENGKALHEKGTWTILEKGRDHSTVLEMFSGGYKACGVVRTQWFTK